MEKEIEEREDKIYNNIKDITWQKIRTRRK
jgi:hypothetical protein